MVKAKYILLIFFKHFGRCSFQNHISGFEMNLNVRKAKKAAEVVSLYSVHCRAFSKVDSAKCLETDLNALKKRLIIQGYTERMIFQRRLWNLFNPISYIDGSLQTKTSFFLF